MANELTFCDGSARSTRTRVLVSLFAGAVLSLASPTDAPAQTAGASGDADRSTCWVGLGMGLSGAATWRESAVDKPFFTPGLMADLLLGGRLSDNYATGIGVRGGWSAPLDFKVQLEQGEEVARHNQLVQGTIYWFHELSILRLSAGPHVSYLVSDSERIRRDPLFGAELSVGVGHGPKSLVTGWTDKVWLAAMLSHALAASNDDQVGARETILKLALSFELESLPPAKPGE